VTLAAGALSVGVASTAMANDAAIAYRKAVFSALGGHTSALAAIVKGEVPHSSDAKAHAKAIGMTAPMVKHIFPEGSGKGDTGALPAIWEKPEAFAKVQENFQVAAAQLAAAADGDDMKAMAAAVGNLGKACKACHDDFRKK
jgi:cytochrome c556